MSVDQLIDAIVEGYEDDGIATEHWNELMRRIEAERSANLFGESA